MFNVNQCLEFRLFYTMIHITGKNNTGVLQLQIHCNSPASIKTHVQYRQQSQKNDPIPHSGKLKCKMHLKQQQNKLVPYSNTSVGHRADPGFLAVSPQVTSS